MKRQSESIGKRLALENPLWNKNNVLELLKRCEYLALDLQQAANKMQPFYFKSSKYFLADYSSKAEASDGFIPPMGWRRGSLTSRCNAEEGRQSLNRARVVGIYSEENASDERGNNNAFTDDSHRFRQLDCMKGFVNHWRAAFSAEASEASRTAAGGHHHAVLPL
jgi:hypothetical protein